VSLFTRELSRRRFITTYRQPDFFGYPVPAS
jgi:hypothetical protein